VAGRFPYRVEEGQMPLDVALTFFEKPLRFRGLLAQADEEMSRRSWMTPTWSVPPARSGTFMPPHGM
jgi:hypothetical protein